MSRRDRILTIAVHAVGAAPLLWLCAASALSWATGAPDAAGLREQFSALANISMVALLATLACTPLNIVFGWKRPLRFRRALGLYFFGYAVTHAGAFAADSGFAPAGIWATTTAQAFLIWGALAVLVSVPLAATANRWSMRRLGRRWKTLHRITYVVAVFSVVHTALIPGDPGEALLPGAILALLLAIRLPSVRSWFVSRRQSHPALVASGVA